MMKCSLGAEVILKKKTGNTIKDQSDLCPTINNISSGNNSYTVILAFDDHFKATDFKNIYEPQNNATSVCSISGNTVYHNHGSGGGSCISRISSTELIVGTNIAPNETVITKFKVE